MTPNPEIKIYDMGGEWWAAFTPESAIEAFEGHYGDPPEHGAEEVPGKSLDVLEYQRSEEDGDTITFRERLNEIISQGSPFPTLFAIEQ